MAKYIQVYPQYLHMVWLDIPRGISHHVAPPGGGWHGWLVPREEPRQHGLVHRGPGAGEEVPGVSMFGHPGDM